MAERCASCGTWLMPGSEFCENCTAPVSGAKKAPPPRDPLRADTTADLELDLALPPSRTPARSAAIGVAEVSSPGTVRSAGAGARGGALVELEVQRIAGYGKAPDGLFGAILYTLHVASRRPILKREAQQAKQLRKAADAAARRALIDLGRALYDKRDALNLGEVHSRLEAVRRDAGTLEARDRERRSAQGELAQKRAQIEARVKEARDDLAPWRDRETRLTSQLDARKGDLERVRARLKRIEIEIRNVRAGAQAGHPVDDARLTALEADAEARRAEVAVAEGPVRELLEEVAVARREVAGRTAALATLEADLRGVDEMMKDLEAELGDPALAASGDIEEAFLALAEDAHVRGLDESLIVESSKAEAALAQLEERRRREQLHARAVDAWDRQAAKRGAMVLGAAALLILAMIVFAIVR